MRYALYSDIHSNLEALEEMMKYLKREPVDQHLVLGDLIGYGADPVETVEMIFSSAHQIIMGNHDKALFDIELATYFSYHARVALEWTRERLPLEIVNRMKDFPLLHIRDGFMLAHASPDAPEEFRYLFYFEDTLSSFAVMSVPLCFIGHTHVPQIFVEKKQKTEYLKEGKYDLDRSERYIINIGSLGQPRDQDNRLSFAIFDDDKYTVEIVRLPYNNRRAAEKIRKANLPRYLADRLL